jgi:hypothetical protein
MSYSGLAFWYFLTSDVPLMWMPFAWADLVFLALFVIAWKGLGETSLARNY